MWSVLRTSYLLPSWELNLNKMTHFALHSRKIMEKCIFANNEKAFTSTIWNWDSRNVVGYNQLLERSACQMNSSVPSSITSPSLRAAPDPPYLTSFPLILQTQSWPSDLPPSLPPSSPHTAGLTQGLQLNPPLLWPNSGVEPRDLFPLQNNGAPRVSEYQIMERWRRNHRQLTFRCNDSCWSRIWGHLRPLNNREHLQPCHLSDRRGHCPQGPEETMKVIVTTNVYIMTNLV